MHFLVGVSLSHIRHVKSSATEKKAGLSRSRFKNAPNGKKKLLLSTKTLMQEPSIQASKLNLLDSGRNVRKFSSRVRTRLHVCFRNARDNARE